MGSVEQRTLLIKTESDIGVGKNMTFADRLLKLHMNERPSFRTAGALQFSPGQTSNASAAPGRQFDHTEP